MAACQCMDCECLLQHNKVVRELRSKTRLQLQQHGEWMVHVNGNTNEAESELNTALRRVTNMNRFQHAEWATVLELRAMAMALHKNVHVMENTHSMRLPCVCYPAQPWSRNDARAQHFRLYEICTSTEIPSIANNANNICTHCNGVNHCGPLMATWNTQAKH